MISLTNQELKIVGFLQQKDRTLLSELRQFAKQDVKAKTLLKVLSELRRKYILSDMDFPKSVIVNDLVPEKVIPQKKQMDLFEEPVDKLIEALEPVKQKDASWDPGKQDNQFQQDFKLNLNRRQVVTKSGIFSLDSLEDWEMMKYFHQNAGKKISIEELKDLYWHNHGSKTPARWMDAITRRVNKLRRAIPALVGRLITVPDPKKNTYYLVM